MGISAWADVSKRALHAEHVAEAKDRIWTDAQLLGALHAVAARDGRCTTGTYKAAYEEGFVKPCGRTFRLRFGSWANALDAAGLPTRHHAEYRNRISVASCHEAVLACAIDLGKVPSVVEYDRWARGRDVPCVALVRERMGGWRGVLNRLNPSSPGPDSNSNVESKPEGRRS